MKTLGISLLALGLSACGPRELAPGPAAVERTYPRKAEEVWAAALSTAKDLDLTIDAHEHDSQGGRIEARRAEGDKVRMAVRSVESEKSVVSVAVDPGQQSLARLIFDRISARLGSGSRPPSP
jgi:hypothetical protein